MCAKLLQSCLTLCDPMDCSLPGSSVHGISQARTLEWVALSFSRRSSQPQDRTCVSCLLCWQAGSLPLGTPGKPEAGLKTTKKCTRCVPRELEDKAIFTLCIFKNTEEIKIS